MSDLPQTPSNPDAWEWRACIGGQWGAWLHLDQPIERFCERNQFNLDNGTYEIRPLYAAPLPRLSDEATREAIAKAMAKWLGYKWEGLNDYSVVDRGFSLFSSGLFQGGRPDLLKFADIVLAAQHQHTSDERVEAWQPIKTAPKNRLLLVGFFNEAGKWRSMHAQYRDDLPRHDDADEDDEPAEAGWYEGSLEAEMLFPVSPTHWMLLPAAPALSRPHEGGE